MIYAFIEERKGEENSLGFLNRCALQVAKMTGKPLRLVKKEGEKPVWEGGFVSLSHKGEYIVCAFSDAPVGVDMEARTQRDFAGLSRRFCGQILDEAAFYRRWTAAESRVKSDGTPLAECLKTDCEKSGRFYSFSNYLLCVIGRGDVLWNGHRVPKSKEALRLDNGKELRLKREDII